MQFRPAGGRARDRHAPHARRFLWVYVAVPVLVLLVTVAMGMSYAVSTTSTIRARSHRLGQLVAARQTLTQILQAGDVGSVELLTALAVDASERGALFADAAGHGRDQTAGWNEFKTEAVGLPGEGALISQFDSGLTVSNAAGMRIAVAAVAGRAVAPADLNQWRDASNAGRTVIVTLAQLYTTAEHSATTDIGHTAQEQRILYVVAAALIIAEVTQFGISGVRVSRRLARNEQAAAASAWGSAFEAKLHRAFQMATDERGCLQVAQRGIDQVIGEHGRASIRMADVSESRFQLVSGDTGGCMVQEPGACPVMRHGAALSSASTTDLDSCLQLAPEPPRSAWCLPVSVGGRTAGVVHVSAEQVQALTTLTGRLGDRLTMLRAFARSELRASHDSLTGLPNRRSLEDAVERLDTTASYTVAFIDLDHFKELNDVHGHDMGDRCLRTFASVLRSAIRPSDLAYRWGGEEFVVVLPACDSASAISVMERVQAELAIAGQIGDRPAFTASFGVHHAGPGESFDDAVLAADRALRQAKSDGRNRICLHDGRRPGGQPGLVMGALKSAAG